MPQKDKQITRNKTYDVIFTALLFAFAIVLSILENALPPLPLPVPGVKLGLSNVIVMFCLIFVSKKNAFVIAVLKSAFLLFSSVSAAFISLCGGIFSVLIMSILLLLFKQKVSYTLLSVSGAVFHNIGQFIGVCILYSSIGLIAYLPFLIIAGVIAGILTAILLNVLVPVLQKIKLKKD